MNLVRSNFDEFEKFPSYLDCEEEIARVRGVDKGSDPASVRATKTHLTDDSRPL